MDHRFKPKIDPRVLRHALKQKEAYYGEGKLNMVEIVDTNALIKKLIEIAEA